jgi:hypothetical protein
MIDFHQPLVRGIRRDCGGTDEQAEKNEDRTNRKA